MSGPLPLKVAIACGGTGGHLFPGLAVAEELRARGAEPLLLISKKQIDATALAGSDLPRQVLSGAEGLQSRNPYAVGRFLVAMAAGVASAWRTLASFRPHVLVGMGGFTSFGPVAAARLLRIPSLIHESNAIPGKANRLNARLADIVLLGLDSCRSHFKTSRCETVGTPVRPAIRALPDRAASRSKLGFDSSAKVALFTGGSQGARGLNALAMGAAPLLAARGFAFIHLTGETDLPRAAAFYRDLGRPHLVAAFSQEMPTLLAAADVALSRSGAASLSELSCARLPALLLPYPHAAEDHQTRNAEAFVSAGAAQMLPERSATAERVAAILTDLAEPSRAHRMKAALAQLAPIDAHRKVVDIIEKVANGHAR